MRSRTDEPDRGVGHGGSSSEDSRKPRDREAFYDLCDKETAAMRLIGSFRSVEAKELRGTRLDKLVADGLVERKSLSLQRTGKRVEAVVLTRKGRDVLRYRSPSGDPQRYYAGLVKPAEIAHDLAIYPAYRQEAERIERAGGRVQRVVLDYEFKGMMARAMNRPDGPDDKAERRRQIAEDLDLPIVDEHLALPDIRIEYLDQEGQEQHLDVEVVTRHYRGSHMAGKQRAGFRMVNSDGPRKAIEDDHHIAWL